MSQKEMVFNVVTNFLKEKGREFEPNSTKVVLATDERKIIVLALVEATKSGAVHVNKESKAYADLPKYWDQTLSNWLRKDVRLNGGEEFKIKNPGSRAGSKDAELKNLKILKEQFALSEPDGMKFEDTDEFDAAVKKFTENMAKIDAAIVAREAKVAAEKAAKVEVNPDMIPESLRHLVSDAS